ncbi:hypothetical protein J6590_059308 [Homalodisca vitripennis]|nr:hypothetical protein J6590_059308 [Homalodisca vitripennis]
MVPKVLTGTRNCGSHRLLVNSYLTKAGIPTLPQPPYSPDGSKQLAPRLSRLFRRMPSVTPSMLGNRAGSAASPRPILKNSHKNFVIQVYSVLQVCDEVKILAAVLDSAPAFNENVALVTQLALRGVRAMNVSHVFSSVLTQSPNYGNKHVMGGGRLCIVLDMEKS